MSSSPVAPPSTILLVEDQEALRVTVESLLLKDGYAVITAVDGINALEKAGGHEGTIDLLLADVEMPRMDGFDLARQLHVKRPEMRILLMSAMPHGCQAVNEGWHFLAKPFVVKMLRAKIDSALKNAPEFSANRGD